METIGIAEVIGFLGLMGACILNFVKSASSIAVMKNDITHLNNESVLHREDKKEIIAKIEELKDLIQKK